MASLMSSLDLNFSLSDQPLLLSLNLLLAMVGAHLDFSLEDGVLFLLFRKLSLHFLHHFLFDHATESILHRVSSGLKG